jgi:hypothetical protein
MGITGQTGTQGAQGITGIVGDTLAHVIQFITGGYTYGGGKSTFGATGAGWWLGMDADGIAKFHVGDINNYVKFDGQTGIIQQGYAAPSDNNTSAGTGLKIVGGKIEAYGGDQTFGGAVITSDGNYMITIGKYLTEVGSAKRYPLNNSTNFTTDGQLHFYEWGTAWYQKSKIGITMNLVALSQTARYWYGMAAAPNGNIYATENGGNIYMQTNGAGNFIALGQTTREWFGMAASPNGDVYASVDPGDIYKQYEGKGAFVPLNQTSRYYRCLTIAPNGSLYTAHDTNGDIYKAEYGR